MANDDNHGFDTEEGGASAPAPAPAAAPQVKEKRKTVADWGTKKVTRTLRIANMCNGIALIALGILVFFVNLVGVTFTTVTVSGYVVFFGMLMTCLECNLGGMAPRLRRNFGFMFSFIGRALFIIFCATMTFAMNNWLGYIIGSFTFLNGFFNGYVICVHPAFKSGELSASGDPYGGYTGGEAEMLTYLKSNPQLAKKAGAAAVRVAKENPDAAFKVMAAAQESGAAKAAAGGAGAAGTGAAAPHANPWEQQ